MTDKSKTEDKLVKTVIMIECGIAADEYIKKLYKKYGESMMLIQHSKIDSIKIQIKEMTDLIDTKMVESKNDTDYKLDSNKVNQTHSIMCVVLGDNYEHIMEDIVEFVPYTTKLIWYIREENIKETLKFMDKNSIDGNLIIIDDTMKIVKIYN
jgi:hypothetical protein